jgi:hypothetical protein
MNLNRIIVVLVVLITGIFVAAAGSLAAKSDRCSPWPACKDDGDDPPPPPPPAECNDPSPSFVYIKPGGRHSDDVAYLASADGCTHNELPGIKGGSVHMTDALLDGSVHGVIIWDEDSNGQNVDQLRRADFTVNSAGHLTALNIDPDSLDLGDPGVPDGDYLGYFFPDVWGSSTHDELYLVMNRIHGHVNGGGSTSLWIYDLNDLSDKRELFRSVDSSDGWISNWSCPADTIHPQAVAGCYRPETPKWNPTGTAIYIQDTLHAADIPEITSNWEATLRLQITRGGLLSSWGVSAPQIVFTGTPTETASGPGGLAAMPRPGETGFGDLIFQDRTPRGILNVETCVAKFTPPVNDPDPAIAADLWLDCLVDNDPYTGSAFNMGDAGRGSWLSSNEILHTIREQRRLVSIYKTNIHTGVSTKLIDDAEGPDTGN